MKRRLWIILAAGLVLALCCAASAQNEVALKLNGSMDAAQSAMANERLRLTIEASGATAVRLLRDDGEETRPEQIWECRDRNMACIEQEWMYQEGTYMLRVQARYDSFPEGTDLWSGEEEANWGAGTQSSTITLTVTSLGLLPEPCAAWVGESAASGLSWLSVSITQTLGMGEWYWVDIGIPQMNGDVEWFDQMQFTENNTLTFPAARFSPGYYAMDVFAGARGYQNRSARLYFVVTVPGEYRVTLYAREGDAFREVCTDQLTVEDAAGGRLLRPDFSGLPALLGPGDGLTGTVLLDERTLDAGIRLEYCPEDEDWQEIFRTDRQVSQGQTALDLPSGLFTRNGRYRLNVWVNAPLLEGNGADHWFPRQEETDGSAVTLTVNGGTEDIASWPSSSDLVFRAQAVGASALRRCLCVCGSLSGPGSQCMTGAPCFPIR